MPRYDKMTNTITLLVQIGLRIIGFWPNTPCVLLLRGFWILTIAMVLTGQYWWLIVHFKTDDMFHLIEGFSVTIEYTKLSIIFIILWLNSRIFYDVLAMMAADWRKATNREMDTMMSKANLSRRFSKVLIGVQSIGVCCFGIEVLLAHTDDYDANEMEYPMETPVRAFTLKLQLPLRCNESPLYELVAFLEFFHQLLSSSVMGVINSLLVTLILHTSGQIEILCDALRDIFLEKNNQQISFSVKELISKHQKIIIFSDKIERIFSYIALVEFLASILLTCCVGFTVITSFSTIQDSDTTDSAALLKAIVFYIAALIEAFIFCFCGEYLSSKSKMISDAAYKSIWYDFKPNDSKLILLIILRSQKRLTITAGRIMDLSLEGFTNIMKASVSYGSVLHAMY